MKLDIQFDVIVHGSVSSQNRQPTKRKFCTNATVNLPCRPMVGDVLYFFLDGGYPFEVTHIEWYPDPKKTNVMLMTAFLREYDFKRYEEGSGDKLLSIEESVAKFLDEMFNNPEQGQIRLNSIPIEVSLGN